VLTETLALAHPILPFVTEEIYGFVPGAEGLLAGGIDSEAAPTDSRAEASIARLIEAVQSLRAWRDFAEVKAGATLPARLAAEGYEETQDQLARLAHLSFSPDGGDPAASIAIPGGAIEVLPTPELDLGAAERKRAARRAAVEQEMERAERKLANQGFVSKAPPDVVAAERDKLSALRQELEAL
jgi:valyl-tRNA synthetase